MRQFIGFIWMGEGPGIRIAIQAESVDEARAAVIADFGEGHRISLWNEDDARSSRATAEPSDAASAEERKHDDV